MNQSRPIKKTRDPLCLFKIEQPLQFPIHYKIEDFSAVSSDLKALIFTFGICVVIFFSLGLELRSFSKELITKLFVFFAIFLLISIRYFLKKRSLRRQEIEIVLTNDYLLIDSRVVLSSQKRGPLTDDRYLKIFWTDLMSWRFGIPSEGGFSSDGANCKEIIFFLRNQSELVLDREILLSIEDSFLSCIQYLLATFKVKT